MLEGLLHHAEQIVFINQNTPLLLVLVLESIAGKDYWLIPNFSLALGRDFSWSPTDNIITYWTPEEQNTPARVTLIKVPSRDILCVKNLFTVADCKMHWQKSGDYLCVKVDRYKSKKEEKDQVKYGVRLLFDSLLLTIRIFLFFFRIFKEQNDFEIYLKVF